MKKQWVLLFVLAIVILLWIRSLGCAPDWIQVHLSDVPDGVEPLYLVAENHGGVHAMHWYHAKLTAFAFDPRITGDEWRRGETENERLGDVQWVRARRFGILARGRDGRWLLWWLGTRDISGPSVLLSLLGYGKAEIRVPDEAKAETPPASLIENMNIPEGEKKG
jgi:hypothetical protein